MVTVISRATGGTVLNATRTAMTDVAANTARVEKVAACGAFDITEYDQYEPFCIDETRGWLLCRSSASSTKLYAKKTLADAPDEIVDFSSDADYEASFILYAVVASGGTWFVFLGLHTTYDGDPKCIVYRSTDAGVTWTLIKTDNYGPPPGFGSVAIRGTMLTYGTYTDVDLTPQGYAVYLTRDCTAAVPVWETVVLSEQAAESATHRFRHVHGVQWYSDTRLYVVFGDSQGVMLARYDYAAETWTETVISDSSNSVTRVASNEGMARLASGELLIAGRKPAFYNPETGAWRRVHIPIPRLFEDDATPYGYDTAVAGVYLSPAIEHAGVLYAGLYRGSEGTAGSDGQGFEGLIVSPDNGEHWVMAYCDPTTNGIRKLMGPWLGRLWGVIQNLDGVTPSVMISFSPAQTRLVDAVLLEAGATNLLAIEASTFTQADGTTAAVAGAGVGGHGWAASASSARNAIAVIGDAVGADTDVAGLHGLHCLKLVGARSATTPKGAAISPSVAMTAGDHIVISVWLKAKTPWPERCQPILYAVAGGGGTLAAGTNATPYNQHVDVGSWVQLRQEYNCTVSGTFLITLEVQQEYDTQHATFDLTGDPVASLVTVAAGDWTEGMAIRFMKGTTLPTGIDNATTYYVRNPVAATRTFRVSATSTGDLIVMSGTSVGTHHAYAVEDWTLYIDAVQAVVDATKWDVSSFQPGGTVRADEWSETTVAGLPATGWSIGFTWRPEHGWAEAGADVGVAVIYGLNASSMALTWDQSEKKFSLTDTDSHTGSSGVIEWRHNDDMRFVITSDGTDSILYIQDPINGLTATTCTGVELSVGGTPDTPIQLVLGGDASDTYVSGHFYGTQLFPSELSLVDITFWIMFPGDSLPTEWLVRLASSDDDGGGDSWYEQGTN
ncbi:MAG: hypothetical protein IMZ50_10810 [Candidatus Atribacteria bacterium]|nr:hypothetical protein [Candidatus Atribacteria bacterium]